MAKADYRTKAGECYRMAALAPGPADQATWLKLAAEWLVLKQRQPRTASAGCRLGSLSASPKLIPEEGSPPGFDIV
jgi:hypothetical protein